MKKKNWLLIVLILLLLLTSCSKAIGEEESPNQDDSEVAHEESSEMIDLVYKEEIDLRQFIKNQGYGEYIDGLVYYYTGETEYEGRMIYLYPYYIWSEDNNVSSKEAQVMMIIWEDFHPIEVKVIPLDLERIFSARVDENGLITLIGGNYRDFYNGATNFTQIAQITVDGEIISNESIQSTFGKSFIYDSVLGENEMLGLGTNLINADGPADYRLLSINLDGTVNYEKSVEDFEFNNYFYFYDLLEVDGLFFLRVMYDEYASVEKLDSEYYEYLLVMNKDGELETIIGIEGLIQGDSLDSIDIIEVTNDGYTLYLQTGIWTEDFGDYITETKKQVYSKNGELQSEVILEERHLDLTRLTDEFLVSELFVQIAGNPSRYFLLDQNLNILREFEFNNGLVFRILMVKENKVLGYLYEWPEVDYFKFVIYEIVSISEK